ncbi:bacteriophage abortive infection AbiH family protein [Streptococcus gordonii]|uniref:AbiH family protein n=1 Tax=Streptococcus gordonii TaxID=1302 RepID=UPI0022833364|nr:AbiH family protein [Streptococcus gordonii]MCY7138568.1 bacteriophage abortive infection AbiH family protein [Streptococcus gordonii]
MADTILILGNGFDLAMGRKTSYNDFLEFAEKLFGEKDVQLEDFLYSNQIDIEKYRNNLYIQFINENKLKLGDNWSNLEIMISQLAEAIDFFRLNSDKLYLESGELYPKYVGHFHKMMNEEGNSASKIFIGTIIFKLYYSSGWDKLERELAISELNNLFINHLDLLTELLEIYLSYRDYIDFEVEQIIPSKTALDAIDRISEASMISFNYTHTPNELYKIPIEKSHFIHGEIDLIRRKHKINTMVFGIEDKGNDVNSDLIPYQKYYQRVVKETGNLYEKYFISTKLSEWGGADSKNIIVFGHSVDPLDKEIFQKCFALTSNNIYNYRFIFTYYNESTKRSIVKNLAIILGKDKLVELTGNRNVVFIKSDDVDGMREVLLD